MTDSTETPPCPECAPGAADPHIEPSLLHVHLTPYGYLLYTPGHERPSFVEGMREAAYRTGYAEAVARLRDDPAYGYWQGPARRHLADYLETVGPDGIDVTSPDHDSVYLDVRDGHLTVTQTTGRPLTVAVNGEVLAVPDRVRTTIELTGSPSDQPDRRERRQAGERP